MHGKHIVVTGGAAGIGAEVCTLLQAQGVKLTVLDLNEPKVKPDNFITVDLNDLASIDQAIAAVDTPIDGLLNIAGVPPKDGFAVTVLRVNFFALRYLTMALLPQMQKGASIVNVSSRAGAAWRENIAEVKALMALPDDGDLEAFCTKHGVGDTRSYLLSKEAVIVWTMAQTESLIARDIRMNTVSPAAVDTGILGDFKTAFGDRVDRMLARVGRPAHPQEVARAVIFLASPESAWLKGVDIGIDGGVTALAISDALELNKG